ncbi:MAG: hypothetical protein ABFC89_04275 [Methanospirillum sp.]
MKAGDACFIIAPIGESGTTTRTRTDKLIRYLIEPALQEFGLVPRIANRMSDGGDIQRQIVMNLIQAPLVIADLTDGNPNVFYELGIRHLTEQPCIHMIEDGNDIPFDLSSMRTIFYNFDVGNSDGIRIQLRDFIRRFQESPSMDNPVANAMRELTAERFLKGLRNDQDDSLASFIIDSNREMLSVLYDVMMELHYNRWVLEHPNMYEERRSREYYPPEWKAYPPAAYDVLRAKQYQFDKMRAAGVPERELIKIRLEMYELLKEWREQQLQQRIDLYRAGAFGD